MGDGTGATGESESGDRRVVLALSDDRSELLIEADHGVTYGIGSTCLDQWVGGRWEHTHDLATPAGARGYFVPVGQEMRVKLPMYGGSRVLALALPPLAAGRYRIRKRFRVWEPTSDEGGPPAAGGDGKLGVEFSACVEFDVDAPD